MDPYTIIKSAIIIGDFEPGQRLTEEALAIQLNISRTPIRKAIQQLESDGLVTPFQRRGVIVREFSLTDIRQIYDLRSILESMAAGEAALNCSAENLKKIIETNELYEKAISKHTQSDLTSIQNIQQTNQAFHEAIFEATNNEHLRFHIGKVIVVPLIFRSFYWYSETKLLQSLESHKTLIEAIRNREPERAKSAMKEHILQGRDYVFANEDKINRELWRGEKND
ncbi:GntR family transcriptional regulator [Planococcus kocurii]|uniref:GntR family transcriptional regulator n=1 Tax=Planococcus kocurii TaxID=1374 RepID=UPI003D0699A4